MQGRYPGQGRTCDGCVRKDKDLKVWAVVNVLSCYVAKCFVDRAVNRLGRQELN